MMNIPGIEMFVSKDYAPIEVCLWYTTLEIADLGIEIFPN